MSARTTDLPSEMRTALAELRNAGYAVRAATPHDKETARLVVSVDDGSRVLVTKSAASRPIGALAKPHTFYVGRCGPYTAFAVGSLKAENLAMKIMGRTTLVDRSSCKPHSVLE